MLVFVKTKKEIVSGSCRYLSDKSLTGVIALNELHFLLNNSIIFLMFIKDISVQSYGNTCVRDNPLENGRIVLCNVSSIHFS